ncbi:MAG TPA: hypothetical protein VN081_02460 [Dongiaceae bacterium]|nr:hypothetical protein [Dongiaceae bacterium]
MTTTSSEIDITANMERWTTELILPILVRQGSAQATLLRELVKKGSEIAPYAFIQNHDYMACWETLRANTDLTTLLLSVTYEYIVRLGGVESSAFKSVAKAFASAVSYTTHTDSFQDSTVTERAVKPDDRAKASDVFTNNMWFVVLVISGWVNVKTLLHEITEYNRVATFTS